MRNNDRSLIRHAANDTTAKARSSLRIAPLSCSVLLVDLKEQAEFICTVSHYGAQSSGNNPRGTGATIHALQTTTCGLNAAPITDRHLIRSWRLKDRAMCPENHEVRKSGANVLPCVEGVEYNTIKTNPIDTICQVL